TLRLRMWPCRSCRMMNPQTAQVANAPPHLGEPRIRVRGDAQTREILQFELLRIWEERPTAMIFVTHSNEEAVLLGHRVIVLKGRPSSIHETISIDLPHPRSRATLQHPRFAELRERVWSTLMREAAQAEFELQR